MATPSKKPIPDGYGTVTPSFTCADARKEIDFLKKALGAEERMVMPCPETKRIMHAEIKIGTSILMLGDAMSHGECSSKSVKELGGSASGFWLYVQDVDKTFAQAIKAGGVEKVPPSDMFWGDRMAAFTCPEGFLWNVATHKVDYTPAEMEEGRKQFMESMKAAAH